MKIADFLRIMIIVTVMAVLYINLQVKIYAFAYQGKMKEQQIEKLAELNGRFKNDILRLRSSDNIGRRLLVKDSQFQFASRNRVVEVSGDRQTLPDMLASGAQKTEGFFSRMALAFSR